MRIYVSYIPSCRMEILLRYVFPFFFFGVVRQPQQRWWWCGGGGGSGFARVCDLAVGRSSGFSGQAEAIAVLDF